MTPPRVHEAAPVRALQWTANSAQRERSPAISREPIPTSAPSVRRARAPPATRSFGERLRAPARDGAIALDPDVARVFRDSEAVNEALRMVIRLARTVGGSAAPSGAQLRSAPHGCAGGSALRAAIGRASKSRRRTASRARSARGEPQRRRHAREPKFEDSE